MRVAEGRSAGAFLPSWVDLPETTLTSRSSHSHAARLGHSHVGPQPAGTTVKGRAGAREMGTRTHSPAGHPAVAFFERRHLFRGILVRPIATLLAAVVFLGTPATEARSAHASPAAVLEERATAAPARMLRPAATGRGVTAVTPRAPDAGGSSAPRPSRDGLSPVYDVVAGAIAAVCVLGLRESAEALRRHLRNRRFSPAEHREAGISAFDLLIEFPSEPMGGAEAADGSDARQ